MEDPRDVQHEGVELRIGVDVKGAPLYGILDRLDRDEDGSLTIVDYKTGGLPNRNYDSQTFANAELYAALCRGPARRTTDQDTPDVRRARAVDRTTGVRRGRERAGAGGRAAWSRITRYYDDGDFPATPSTERLSILRVQGPAAARTGWPSQDDKSLGWRGAEPFNSPTTTAVPSRRTFTCT